MSAASPLGDLQRDVGKRKSGDRAEHRQMRPEGRAKRRPAQIEENLDSRRADEDRDEHDPLDANGDRGAGGDQREGLRRERRPLERQRESVRREDEGREERVLGHERARVDVCRQEQHEPSGDERVQRRHETARPEVRGHRCEGHEDPVDDLCEAVAGRRRVDQPGRGDGDRVEDAETGVRQLTDQKLAPLGEALRKLGVDELVDHDPRRRDPPCQGRANDDRGEDEAGED
jgi:hypothetical protein